MGKITSFSSFAMESGAAVRDIIMVLSALVAALMTMLRAPMGNDGDQNAAWDARRHSSALASLLTTAGWSVVSHLERPTTSSKNEAGEKQGP